jgi:hypothetical protein
MDRHISCSAVLSPKTTRERRDRAHLEFIFFRELFYFEGDVIFREIIRELIRLLIN